MHTQWECSTLRVDCSKPAKPAHCIPAGRWDWEEPMGSKVLPRWQQPALAHCKGTQPSDCTKGGHLGKNSKDAYVLGTQAQMGREFYWLTRNAEYIYKHLLRSLALMAKLNAASKKSCSKCFFILFLFNKWEMLPNSGLKSSIFLKKQVVEGSLWLLADTVHAQLKNMPAWPRASNQAPERTHSFPEVMKYSKNL